MEKIEAASKQIDAGVANRSQSSLSMVIRWCVYLSWHRRRLNRIPCSGEVPSCETGAGIKKAPAQEGSELSLPLRVQSELDGLLLR